MLQICGQGGDGDVRGVGADDGIGTAVLLQLGIGALFDFNIFGNGFHNQIHISSDGKIVAGDQIVQQRFFCFFGHLATGNLPVQTGGDLILAVLSNFCGQIPQIHLVAGCSGNLGNTAAHGTGATNHNIFHSSFLLFK